MHQDGSAASGIISGIEAVFDSVSKELDVYFRKKDEDQNR